MRNNDGSLSLFGWALFGGSFAGAVAIIVLTVLLSLVNSVTKAHAQTDRAPSLFCETAGQVKQVVETHNKASDPSQFVAWIQAVNAVNIIRRPVCSIAPAFYERGEVNSIAMVDHVAYEIRRVRVTAVMEGLGLAWMPVNRVMYTLILLPSYYI